MLSRSSSRGIEYLRDSPVMALNSATVNSFFPERAELADDLVEPAGVEDEAVDPFDDLLPLGQHGQQRLKLPRRQLELGPDIVERDAAELAAEDHLFERGQGLLLAGREGDAEIGQPDDPAFLDDAAVLGQEPERQDEDRPGRLEALLQLLERRPALGLVRLVIPGEEGDDPAAQERQAVLGDQPQGVEGEDAEPAFGLEGPGQGLDPGSGQAREGGQPLSLKAFEAARLGQGEEHVLFAERQPGEKRFAPGRLELVGGRGIGEETRAASEGRAPGPELERVAPPDIRRRGELDPDERGLVPPGEGVVDDPDGRARAEEERPRPGPRGPRGRAGPPARRRTRTLSSAALLRIGRRDEAHAAQGRIAGHQDYTNGVAQVKRFPPALGPEPPGGRLGLEIPPQRGERHEPGDEVLVDLDDQAGLDDVDDDAPELLAQTVLEEAVDAPLDEGLFGLGGVALPLGGPGGDRLEGQTGRGPRGRGWP